MEWHSFGCLTESDEEIELKTFIVLLFKGVFNDRLYTEKHREPFNVLESERLLTNFGFSH